MAGNRVDSNLPQFGRRMRQRGDRLPRAVNALLRAVGLAVGSEVIDRTPVDEGTARSNWLGSLGVPTRATIEPYRQYPKGSRGNGRGTGETANAEGAKQQIRTAIAARKPGQSIIIQNNQPYIGRLNDGYSGQAPALFVQMGVRKGILTLHGQRLEI